MMEIDEERYQRAKARGIMLLTASLDPTLQLGSLIIDEIREMLPSVDVDSAEFCDAAALLATLTSWVAGSIEADADVAERPALVMLAEFAEYLREAD